MATTNTRSLTGATHVPLRQREISDSLTAVATFPSLEDPLDEGSRSSDTTATMTARPFAKARLMAKLCNDTDNATTILAMLREDHVPGGANATSEVADSALFHAVERYASGRAYRPLVGAMRHVPMQPLLGFIRRWLAAEKELLQTAVTDWAAQAKAIAVEGDADEGEGEQPPARTLAKMATHVTRSFDRLTREVSELSKELEGLKDTAQPQKAPPTMERIPKASGREAEEEARERAIQAFRLPKAEAWTRLWDDESTQQSARVLAAYMAPDQEAADSILMFMAHRVTADAVVGLTDMALARGVEEVTTRRHKEIGGLIKEIASEAIGVLFLERLDFTPVGNVRGELVYTLPLTPGENITVSHKEWSNTAEEYVKEVEEELEKQIEKEVSESTELTESSESESEVKHKASAELTLGYDPGSTGGWRFEAKGGYEYENCRRNATEHAVKRNREITESASSRSKEQHKLTFKISRERHVEDEQVRVIKNESDAPVRWDFYRLMKKWEIDLYHVGERLTYEVMVPEPGSYLLRRYVKLDEIQREIDGGDPFDLAPGGIGRANWSEVAARYGADIRPPPRERLTDLFFSDTVPYPGKKEGGTRILPIEVPEGYVIIRAESLLRGRTITCVPSRRDDDGRHLRPIECGWDDQQEENWTEIPDNAQQYSWIWNYHFDDGAECYAPTVLIHIEAVCTDTWFKKWQLEAWSQIREAARGRWITRLEALQNRRDRLLSELYGKDSLKLRQQEHEEVTKGVLRWLLGPEFEFYPEMLQTLHEHLRNRLIAEAEAEGTTPPALDPLYYYDENTQRLLGDWYQDLVAEYGDMIRFIHQAIEWENVKWILYPYFWTFPGRWDFKQSLEHPDFYHCSFLRAGCARVVIPIREGFETAWLEFAEGDLPNDHPYVTVANEMRDRAHTNYMYTPDPNREELERIGEHIDRWFEYTPTGAMHIEEGAPPTDF